MEVRGSMVGIVVGRRLGASVVAVERVMALRGDD